MTVVQTKQENIIGGPVEGKTVLMFDDSVFELSLALGTGLVAIGVGGLFFLVRASGVTLSLRLMISSWAITAGALAVVMMVDALVRMLALPLIFETVALIVPRLAIVCLVYQWFWHRRTAWAGEFTRRLRV